MKKKRLGKITRRYPILIFVVIALLSCGCATAKSKTNWDTVLPEPATSAVEPVKFVERVLPYRGKSNHSPIVIENNPNAVDSTWDELTQFLMQDKTERTCYRDTDATGWGSGIFMCSDFAVLLHNSAEANGIKSAVVIIHIKNLGSPHALNAFMVIDKGLVYIDDTGTEECYTTDKIAYLEIGKKSGAIDLQSDFPLDYEWFSEQMNLFYGYSEAIIKCKDADFETQLSIYDSFYSGEEFVYISGNYGIVKSIEVYW